MSDDKINIRILFWHFKLKISGKFQITFNHYWFDKWPSALKKPFQIHNWDLS